jgi:hypothetical protein
VRALSLAGVVAYLAEGPDRMCRPKGSCPLAAPGGQIGQLVYAEGVNGSQMSDAPGHAFISYVREDGAHVDRLQSILEAAGIRVWRDTADLWPGQDWKIEIRRAIKANSLAFIACFSGHSQRRIESYQNEEVILAVEQMRVRRPGQPWLIPVRFADCDIPDFDLGAGRTLDSLQRVDLFNGSWERGTPRLVAAVLRILGGPGAGLQEGPGRPLDAGLWHFEDAESVTVVCPELPPDMQAPVADPTHPDYAEMYRYRDLDSLFELYGHLRAANPSIQIDVLDPGRLTPRYFAAHLISIGGVTGNGATLAIRDRLRLPVVQVGDWSSPGGVFFEASDDGHERRFFPYYERSDNSNILKEDVALFARAINPFNGKHTVSILSGMHAKGTYGIVRALTDPAFRERNAEYLANRFRDTHSICVLTRVGIESGVVLTPDWTSTDNILFEWGM